MRHRNIPEHFSRPRMGIFNIAKPRKLAWNLMLVFAITLLLILRAAWQIRTEDKHPGVLD